MQLAPFMFQFAVRSIWSALTGFALAVTLTPAAGADVGETSLPFVEPGHSAIWFDPARNGEGWVLEILAAGRAAMYWYTYDEFGNQRWLIGLGSIVQDLSGEYIHFPELVVARGAQFGPDFDPDDVHMEVVGEATIRFSSCAAGSFSYQAFDQTGTMQLERISETMGVGCSPPHGRPGDAVESYAGQSGSWFDVSHTGEGFSIQWSTHDRALVTWYTYDPEGNQHWLTGVGAREGDSIVVPMLYSTSGGRFGSAFDPDAVELAEWGSLVIQLECNSGTATYASTIAGFGSGTQKLTRLTALAEQSCPWQPPRFADLFQVHLLELPVPPSDPFQASIAASSVSDDGTVVALRMDGSELYRWSLTRGSWETLSTAPLSPQGAFISPGGEFIIANEAVSADSSYLPVRYTDDTGLHHLPGLSYERALAYGVSQDALQVVGTGYPAGDSSHVRAWRWNAQEGQVSLPQDGRPAAISNDGSTVVGIRTRVAEGVPIDSALIWRGDAVQVMRDSGGSVLRAALGCSAHCGIVAGTDQSVLDVDHPHSRQAWFG